MVNAVYLPCFVVYSVILYSVLLMNKNLECIRSSYKLHSGLIKKMTSKQVVTSSGKKYTGCSKLMIAAMIHFSHICDTKGVICDFKVSDLQLVLRCELKSAYNILDSLVEREMISVEDKNSFSGTRTIILKGNDFSFLNATESNSSVRYLNTNYSFFNYRENQGYDKFLDLSLFSMRLLLLLLFQYNKDNGYRVSYDTLCKQLGVEKRSYIHKYIKEINSLLPKNTIYESPNRIKRLKFGSISIASYRSGLMPQKGLSATQDTYYSRKWIVELKKSGYSGINEFGSLHYASNRICSIVNTFLQKGKLSLTFIENSIGIVLSDHGLLSEQALTDIYQNLLSAST